MTTRSYSYSQINQAYRCNRLYKYLFIDKLVPDVAPSGDQKFGTAMHTALQAMLEGDNAEDTFEAFWGAEKEAGNQYSRYGWESLRKQGAVFLERFRERYSAGFAITQMEKRLHATIGGVRFEGTPDFIGTFEGVPSVVDFKTAGSVYPRERIICNDQLPLYSRLAEECLGFKVEQYVYIVMVKGEPPRLQKPLILPFDQAAQDKMIDNLLAVCKDLDTRTEFHQNKNSCLMGTKKCDFWGRCFPEKEDHGRDFVRTGDRE